MRKAYQIEKIYHWDDEENEVVSSYRIIDEHNAVIDCFDTYTKAERRIVELIEKEH